MPTQVTWLCAADAGSARILRSTGARTPLESIATLKHGPYEHGRYEEPGKSQESATTARHSFTDAEGPVRREKRDFAREVADYIDAAAAKGAFDRLIVAAPPKFLGDLRGALGDQAKAKVVNEIAKDVTKETDAALQARIVAILYPGAAP